MEPPNHKRAGMGFILESLDDFIHERDIHLYFPTSNNEAKYEALIRGMLMAEELAIWILKVCNDS